MPDESELIAMRSAEVTEPDLSRLSPTERAGDRVRRLWGGFVEQGFAAGYDQGWNDAKAGRPYGATPAGMSPAPTAAHWVCSECGWPWPLKGPPVVAECDNCGGELEEEH